ncbi:MAG: hypothetical protein R3293_11660 [Candidatus Promineifilaceae bacterium]|nr:hypothetical protein [Candidatus Promineifilaceae bacterium]
MSETKTKKWQRSLAVALTFVPLMLAVMISIGAAEERAVETGTADLWMDMLIGPPLVPFFNSEARDDDMARVDHPTQVGQLAGITTGRKLVVFKSLAEAEQYLPLMADQIDIAGYNLEHGPVTPPEEQADPVGSIQEMRALADNYGLDLAFGPDHDFALSHGPAMAPYVDYFVLQIQRQQTNPPVVQEFVTTIVPQLRDANPDLQISAQVRTEGDVQAIVALIDSLLPYLDGVSILTSPATVEIAKELVLALRAGPTYQVYFPQVLGE